MVLTIERIEMEAQKFRKLIEKNKFNDIPCITEDFPIMNCKLASLLFAYHILYKWCDVIVYGISGFAKDNKENETISHYWLEIKNIAIDITADQYNIISDSHLNIEIIKNRPFKAVSIQKTDNFVNYKIFKVRNRDKLQYGFSDFHQDFIEDLSQSYKILMK